MDGQEKHQAPKLIASLAVPHAAAAAGAVASVSAASYYASLQQRPWAPPSWVFGPVWTTPHAMMGISTWLVWRKARTRDIAKELAVFYLQLAFNRLWSWLFFK